MGRIGDILRYYPSDKVMTWRRSHVGRCFTLDRFAINLGHVPLRARHYVPLASRRTPPFAKASGGKPGAATLWVGKTLPEQEVSPERFAIQFDR
jgi:hypothetical protein